MLLFNTWTILSSVLSLPLTGAAPPSPLVVNLKTGQFQGVRTNNGTELWLGIPFAQPPVESLRFKAPVPITVASKGVQDASTFGNACPQVPAASLGAPIGEDCLVLNVRRTHTLGRADPNNK